MQKLLLIFALLTTVGASGEELSIAAASDLNFAMKDIAQQYQRDTGNTLRLSFGSSGNFFIQIQNGAPFDLFFSADIAYPQKLAQAGLAEPATLYRYAVGKIVLWIPNNSRLDLSRGIDVLLDPSIRKVAIANPAHAPYGRAAEEALKKAGIYDRIKDKLVFGENISQTAEFIQTGNADIGILAQSLAVSPAMKNEGRFAEVPTNLYTPIEQGAIVLKSSNKQALTKEFLEYLQRPAARQIFARYGFSLPRAR